MREFTGVSDLTSAECHRLLEQIRHGLDASNVEFDDRTFVPGTIYLLPRFLPGSNVALHWSEPTVGFIPDGSDAPVFAWRYCDRALGSATGTLNPLTHIQNEEAGFSAELIRYHSTRQLSRSISKIVMQGDHARWTLRQKFTKVAIQNTMTIAKRVAAEVTQGREVLPVIDELEAETIVDNYILGSDDGRAPLFLGHVDRACGNLRDGAGDRYTWLMFNSTSALESAVRRKIGDPEKGRVIRALHRDLGAESTVDRIREEYIRRYPNRASVRDTRIIKALTVYRTPNSSALPHSEVESIAHGGGAT